MLRMLFNAEGCAQRFILSAPPQGQAWRRVVDTARASPDDICEVGREESFEDQRCYLLRDRSMVILIAR